MVAPAPAAREVRPAMRRGRADGGSALVLVLVMLTVVAIAVATTSMYLATRSSASHLDMRRVRLVAMVDAAMAETLAWLDDDAEFRGLQPTRFAGGEISSVVTQQSLSRVEVLATAHYDGAWASIRSEVDVQYGARVLMWRRSIRYDAAPRP